MGSEWVRVWKECVLCPETLAESKLLWVVERTVRSIVCKVASLNEVSGFGSRFFGVLRGKRSNRQGGKASKTWVDCQGLLNTAKCFLLFTSLFLYGDLLYLAFCPMQKECKALEIEIRVYFHVHFPLQRKTQRCLRTSFLFLAGIALLHFADISRLLLHSLHPGESPQV